MKSHEITDHIKEMLEFLRIENPGTEYEFYTGGAIPEWGDLNTMIFNSVKKENK